MARRRSDAELRGLPDLARPGLEILFVGINPGLTSARVGHYYAGPGNLFWRCLHESGLTPTRWTWADDHRLLDLGIGIIDCVPRPTRSSSDLRAADFRTATPHLLERLARYRPRIVCFNGLTAYRACIDPAAPLGLQARRIAGAVVFVVPSTSAANARFSRAERVAWFVRLRELRDALRAGSGDRERLPPAGGRYTNGEPSGPRPVHPENLDAQRPRAPEPRSLALPERTPPRRAATRR